MHTPDNFGPKRFSRMFSCNTYDISGILSNPLQRLLDHGFVADRACVWDDRLKGHELAVVARTYCDDDAINNPPPGLRCVRLPKAVMGADDLGTAIAVAIVGKTDASEEVLSACTNMPADMLAYMISLDMADSGYCVALKIGEIVNFPVARLVKI